MEDADQNDIAVDPDVEEEEDDDEIGEDEDGEEEEDLIDQPSQAAGRSESESNAPTALYPQSIPLQASHPTEQAPALSKASSLRYDVRPEAISASLYDIVPTMAAPQSTSINAITATPDMRYWFSGGTDCYIRKYDGIATINGKTLLTVAQRHPFVDSVTKAGVLMSYWDNEEPVSKTPGSDHPLSPVYSLAVQSEALWILSGLDSGSINLYSVRYEEGKRITYLNQHKSAVSVLKLAQDEKSVLSGSWDKKILDWDLNTGQVKRSFEGSGGQISAIEIRPKSLSAISEETIEPFKMSENFSSNNDKKVFSNGFPISMNDGDANDDAHGSQTDSLFGGSDTNSLFLDTNGDNAPLSALLKDEDGEVSITVGKNSDSDEKMDPQSDSFIKKEESFSKVLPTDLTVDTQPSPVEHKNEVSHDVITSPDQVGNIPKVSVPQSQDGSEETESTFLGASIDGTIRVWDRRQPNPVAFIPTRTGVPPWCTGACWSPDGNFIYAGRRNGTVEEFSLHRGLAGIERTLKFPQVSGPVTALRAMPNGRHLIW